MVESSLLEMPLKKIIALSAGTISESRILVLIDKINGDVNEKRNFSNVKNNKINR